VTRIRHHRELLLQRGREGLNLKEVLKLMDKVIVILPCSSSLVVWRVSSRVVIWYTLCFVTHQLNSLLDWYHLYFSLQRYIQ